MPPIADSLRQQPESLSNYPTDQEALVAIQNKPLTATTTTSSVPPKPNHNGIPSPRSKGNKSWRPRLGSSDGASPRQTTRKIAQPPYPLERSNSSTRLRRTSSPVGELPTRLTRSLSSSSVVSCGSAAEPSTNTRDLNSLMSSLQTRTQKYGEEHPRVGSCWNKIGNAYFMAKQYSHALDSYKHAVICYQTGEAELACTYNNMGTAYWASGRPDKAIQFLHKALDVYEYHEVAEGRKPQESLTVASTLYQMGLCHSLLSEYDESLKCLKKCQKIQGKVLGPMDIQVGRTLDAIGKVHYFKERYSMALSCHEEARRIKSGFCEPESPAMIQSWMNIAAVEMATNNWSTALNKYHKVMCFQKAELTRCRNHNGQPFLSRATQELGETLHLMGHVHRHMGQEEQAQQYYREAAAMYVEAGLGAEDPRVKALK